MLFQLAITFATTILAPVQQKQPSTKTQVIYVKESKEPCTGVAPMECLQVKESVNADWSNFYTNINGFKYTPGYRYKLRVKVTPVKNPPADAPNVKYTLVKVLEKKRVPVTAANSQWTSIAGKKWILSKMDNADQPDEAIWVEFDTDKKRNHGRSGCNGLMGGFSTSGNNITFSKVAGTLMACESSLMRREGSFLKQFGDHTFKYQVVGQQVHLLQNGKPVLQFKLQDKDAGQDQGGNGDTDWASISGKKWVMTRLNEASISSSGVWLEFDPARNRFYGKGGCNNISGGYSTNNNAVTFTQAVSTFMACPDAGVMSREADFLRTLGGHTFKYRLTDGTINLFENDHLVMQFAMEDKSTTAANPNQWTFIGSKKWNVIKLNDATLADSGIWIEFDTEKNRFHGKGGCNSISGGYNATGDQIKFAQAVSTRMACPDPAVMRREADFLKLLSEASYRYDVADQTLNLYKDGKIILMFGMQDK